MINTRNKLSKYGQILLIMIGLSGCGIVPENVDFHDKRLIPLFKAISEVRRDSLGFSEIDLNSKIRLETKSKLLSNSSYDVMLHIDGKTSRTISFKKLDNEKYYGLASKKSFMEKENIQHWMGLLKNKLL